MPQAFALLACAGKQRLALSRPVQAKCTKKVGSQERNLFGRKPINHIRMGMTETIAIARLRNGSLRSKPLQK
jgi:hypothetical protein